MSETYQKEWRVPPVKEWKDGIEDCCAQSLAYRGTMCFAWGERDHWRVDNAAMLVGLSWAEARGLLVSRGFPVEATEHILRALSGRIERTPQTVRPAWASVLRQSRDMWPMRRLQGNNYYRPIDPPWDKAYEVHEKCVLDMVNARLVSVEAEVEPRSCVARLTTYGQHVAESRGVVKSVEPDPTATKLQGVAAVQKNRTPWDPEYY